MFRLLTSFNNFESDFNSSNNKTTRMKFNIFRILYRICVVKDEFVLQIYVFVNCLAHYHFLALQ